MNSETPRGEERDEISSLVAESTYELGIRASLVKRGLRDILTQLQAPSIHDAQDKAMELHRQRRFSESVAACCAGLEMEPTDEILWQIKGVSLAMLGRVDEGLESLDHALQTNIENPHYWVLRANLLRRLNRTEERAKCWREVIRIEPHFKGAWKEVGCCLLDLGRYEDAVEAFDAALKQDGSDEACHSQMDIALRELARGRGPEESPPSAHRQEVSSEPAFIVAYHSRTGWHVVNEDDVQWDCEGTRFGPFFSNYDPNEGPVGSGKALAEALAEEKRRLYPNGPARSSD